MAAAQHKKIHQLQTGSIHAIATKSLSAFAQKRAAIMVTNAPTMEDAVMSEAPLVFDPASAAADQYAFIQPWGQAAGPKKLTESGRKQEPKWFST